MPDEKIVVVEENKEPEIQETPVTLSREQLDLALSQEEDEIEEKPKEKAKQVKSEKKEKEAEVKTETEVKVETPVVDPKMQELVAENEKLKGRVANQDTMIARFGTEIGLLRKKTPEQEREKLDEIRNLYLEDPIKGQEAYQAYKDKLANSEREAQEIQATAVIERNKTVTAKLIPEFEKSLAEISELLSADGLPKDVVDNFQKNPYAFDPDVLISLQKRNKAYRENLSLKTEIEKLKTENEELKKKPGALLKKIEKAANSRPMTADTGGAEKEEAIPSKPFHLWTRDELNRASFDS